MEYRLTNVERGFDRLEERMGGMEESVRQLRKIVLEFFDRMDQGDDGFGNLRHTRNREEEDGNRGTRTRMNARDDERVRTVEIPYFTGECPYGWISQAEHYLKVNRVPVEKQVKTASICLGGRAKVWFQWWKPRNPTIHGRDFVRLQRFHSSVSGKPYEAQTSFFTCLKQENLAEGHLHNEMELNRRVMLVQRVEDKEEDGSAANHEGEGGGGNEEEAKDEEKQKQNAAEVEQQLQKEDDKISKEEENEDEGTKVGEEKKQTEEEDCNSNPNPKRKMEYIQEQSASKLEMEESEGEEEGRKGNHVYELSNSEPHKEKEESSQSNHRRKPQQGEHEKPKVEERERVGVGRIFFGSSGSRAGYYSRPTLTICM